MGINTVQDTAWTANCEAPGYSFLFYFSEHAHRWRMKSHWVMTVFCVGENISINKKTDIKNNCINI